MNQPTDDAKSRLRTEARDRRRSQPDKDKFSRRIIGAVMSLPEYATAETVMFYVGVHSEVRTTTDIAMALEMGKRVVVPWCGDDHQLNLFELREMSDLQAGRYRIPEPPPQLRDQPDRVVRPDELDLVIVPGVAFDIRGGRIGQGKGYYDRLLQQARPSTTLIAPAFECQLYERVPTDPHDVMMDAIVTENGVYRCHPA